MILRYIFFSIVIHIFINGQWLSLDLSKAETGNFTAQTEPVICSIILTGTQTALFSLSAQNRIGLGVSFSAGVDMTASAYQTSPWLLPPMVEGQFLVTENLALKGKMNLLSSKTETLHLSSYGVIYLFTHSRMAITIGWLMGPRHLNTRFTDVQVVRETSFFPWPLYLGVGFNNYSANFFKLAHDPRPLKSSITYLNAATTITFTWFELNIQTQIHPKFVQFNLQFIKSFF